MRLATAVMLVVAVLTGAILLGGLWLDTRESADARCLAAEIPAGVAVSEVALISAEATAWPVGRRCEWQAASGDGVVVTQTGWLRTIGFAVVGALSACVAILGMRRRRPAAIAPLAVCLVVYGLAVFWAG
ncbi:hypothetical protein [Microbacterium sp. NPDC080220]|uniref:hypothetical protein n=1 Tax=Microbacterium sp. NPDC080220 TaxID=3161017 RepID=UPI0034394304